MKILFIIGIIVGFLGLFLMLLSWFLGDKIDKCLAIKYDSSHFFIIGIIGLLIGSMLAVVCDANTKYTLTIYQNNDVVATYEHCKNIEQSKDSSNTVIFYSNDVKYQVVLEPGQVVRTEKEEEK